MIHYGASVIACFEMFQQSTFHLDFGGLQYSLCVSETLRAVGIIFKAAEEWAASRLTKFGLLKVVSDGEGGVREVCRLRPRLGRVVGDAFLTEVSDWRFRWVSAVSVHRDYGHYGPRVRRVRWDGNHQSGAAVSVESTVGQVDWLVCWPHGGVSALLDVLQSLVGPVVSVDIELRPPTAVQGWRGRTAVFTPTQSTALSPPVTL